MKHKGVHEFKLIKFFHAFDTMLMNQLDQKLKLIIETQSILYTTNNILIIGFINTQRKQKFSNQYLMQHDKTP